MSDEADVIGQFPLTFEDALGRENIVPDDVIGPIGDISAGRERNIRAPGLPWARAAAPRSIPITFRQIAGGEVPQYWQPVDVDRPSLLVPARLPANPFPAATYAARISWWPDSASDRLADGIPSKAGVCYLPWAGRFYVSALAIGNGASADVVWPFWIVPADDERIARAFEDAAREKWNGTAQIATGVATGIELVPLWSMLQSFPDVLIQNVGANPARIAIGVSGPAVTLTGAEGILLGAGAAAATGAPSIIRINRALYGVANICAYSTAGTSIVVIRRERQIGVI